METVITLNSATASTSLSPSAAIWQDVLAQAMTGELIAALNYTSLAEICDDPEEIADEWCPQCRGSGRIDVFFVSA